MFPLPTLHLIPSPRARIEKEAANPQSPIIGSGGEAMGHMTGEATVGDGDVVRMAIRGVTIVAILIAEGFTIDIPLPHRRCPRLSSNLPSSRWAKP